MRDLTLVLPYYRNPGMLIEQQAIWRSYPDDLKARLHVIVVDDGSPDQTAKPAVEDTGLASFRLYRTLEDIRWNWLFCRNLGVHMATTEWVLLTDIDHVLPAQTLLRLVVGPLDPTSVYRLARVDAPRLWPFTVGECAVREEKKFHPNTWVMTRAMFDAIGGYDERLSGCYGTDGEFRDRVRDTSRNVVMLPDVLIRYSRDVLPDASTVGLARKGNAENDDDLRRRREQRRALGYWRPKRLTFPWELQCTVVSQGVTQ